MRRLGLDTMDLGHQRTSGANAIMSSSWPGRCQSRDAGCRPLLGAGAPSFSSFGFDRLLLPIAPIGSHFHAATFRPDRAWPSRLVHVSSLMRPSTYTRSPLATRRDVAFS